MKVRELGRTKSGKTDVMGIRRKHLKLQGLFQSIPESQARTFKATVPLLSFFWELGESTQNYRTSSTLFLGLRRKHSKLQDLFQPFPGTQAKAFKTTGPLPTFTRELGESIQNYRTSSNLFLGVRRKHLKLQGLFQPVPGSYPREYKTTGPLPSCSWEFGERI